MKIKNIMNKAIVIDFDTDVKEAAKIMSKRNIGSLVILKNNKIKGIITERDILKNISSLNKKISSVMTKKVITIELDQDLENVTLIMTKHKIKRLLITEEGELVGIITATDIIANSDLLNEELLFM